MRLFARILIATTMLACLPIGAARATTFPEAISIFRNAGASAGFFSKSYAYARVSERRLRCIGGGRRLWQGSASMYMAAMSEYQDGPTEPRLSGRRQGL